VYECPDRNCPLRLTERRATLLDRIAIEESRPQAASQASEAAPSPPSWGPRSRAPAQPSRACSHLALVVFVQLRRVRVAQRAQGAGGRDAGGEAVAAEQVQIVVLERGEPGDILVLDLVSLGAELVDGGVDVPDNRARWR
jgi:hypothetical protein